jgi:hypothetical protein
MKLTCNTPRKGALAHIVATLTAIAVVVALPAAAQTVTRSTTSAADLAATAQGPDRSQLGVYYRQLEQRLVSQGNLRQDRNAGALDAATIARNFMAIAMRTEYGSGMSGSGSAAPLRRWEQPIRIGVRFGASVPAAQQRSDQAALTRVAQRLQRASGHPVGLTNGAANFHVLVLSDAERANAGPVLQQMVPGLSRNATRAVTRMGRNTFCMVIAIPAADPNQGIARAIAIVRAEHPPLMRQSCMEEELAQGMGLSNDSPAARPSIFNDDEEFGVLTRHDELLLRMLYDDSLRPGMSPGSVNQHIGQLAQAVLARG